MENKKFDEMKRSFVFRGLYYWEKLIGANPLTISKSTELEFSYVGLVYGCVLTVMYTFVVHHAFTERVALSVPGETTIAIVVDYMGIIFQFIHNSLSWLVFAFRQNRAKSIVDNLVRAENTSIKLGIPEDYDKYFRDLATFVTVNSIMFFVSLAISMEMWSYYKNFDVLTGVAFCAPSIGTFNMQILFIWSLVLIKNKFHRLNGKVRTLMQNDCSNGSETNIATSMDSLSHRSSDLLAVRINMVSRLHRQLRDVLSLIEGHFALIILSAILKGSIWLTLDIYDSYFYMKANEGLSIQRHFFHVVAVCHWIFCNVFTLIAISKICGSTVREANDTGNVLYSMLNNCRIFGDTREAAKLNVLSLDLLHNRVRISLLGCFELNDFFIYGAIATITTYLTIMLQL